MVIRDGSDVAVLFNPNTLAERGRPFMYGAANALLAEVDATPSRLAAAG